MKALVTGGAGFIGSHLAEILLHEGNSVTILDNFSTGQMENISNFQDEITVIKGDFSDSDAVSKAVKGVNTVFHLGAQASVAISVKNPQFDATSNILGTINLLKHSVRENVKNFIFTSSGGAVYGEPDQIPVPEEHPTRPLSPYGISKLVGEYYVRFFGETSSLDWTIVRPANIYGPRQDPLGEAGVVSIFLNKILEKKPLIVFGDGTSSRDYLYVKDLVELLILCVENVITGTFNAGTSIETTIKDLTQTVKNATNSNPEIIFDPPRKGDVYRISLENSKAKEKTGWKPRTGLNEGISEVWSWIKNKRDFI